MALNFPYIHPKHEAHVQIFFNFLEWFACLINLYLEWIDGVVEFASSFKL